MELALDTGVGMNTPAPHFLSTSVSTSTETSVSRLATQWG